MGGWHWISSTPWSDIDYGTPMNIMNVCMFVIDKLP